MQELYIGMPLLDIIDQLEKINVQESFKNNTRNADNIVTKVSLSHKNVSFMEMIKNGGTEDTITDCNNDGFANSRTVIKKNASKVDIINDINIDGKKD